MYIVRSYLLGNIHVYIVIGFYDHFQHFFQLILTTRFNMRVVIMIFIATFNNISALPWQSVLLVEVTGVSGENH